MLLIPLLPPFSPVAISQSTLDNVQTQAGTVTANETLNVVDASVSTTGQTSSMSGVSTATGNAYWAATESGSMAVHAWQQTVSNAVSANTNATVTTNAGAQASLSTVATGNSGETDSIEAGAVTGTVNQTVAAGGSVTAFSANNAGTAQAGAISTSTEAYGNDHGVSLADASATLTLNQLSNGPTSATGGTSLNYTPGAATFSALAVANNFTDSTTGNSSQSLTLNQTSTNTTTSEQDAFIGNGQAITGAATSTGNNISISNTTGGLSVTETQNNTGFIQAQSQVSGNEYGSGEAQAYAVANSAMLGNYGQTLNLVNSQSNTGNGAVANATYSGTGSPGYDAYASSTVMGNAVTGFACSDCNGTLTVSNTQVNNATLAANTTIDTAASNRSVTGTATAVGNSATFYVSKPSH